MNKFRELFKIIGGLQEDASTARATEYQSGYLDALALVMEEMQSIAWEEGVDLEEEDSF